MSETTFIKELGDTVAKEIFTTFGWKRESLTDVKWDCVLPEKHKKKKTDEEQKEHEKERRLAKKENREVVVKTLKHVHPSDGVYHYYDPYEGKRIYINFDFKSYAKSSLGSYTIIDDLKSLGCAIECANIAGSFKELFVDQTEPHYVDGALFIYNHDGEYDKDFDASLAKKIPKSGIHTLKGNNRIFVFGPQQVVELYSIAKHYKSYCFDKGESFVRSQSGFVSPDLQISKVSEHKTGPATVEMLTSKWVLAKVLAERVEILVYLKSQDMTKKSFKYLIDAILQFQLLDDNNIVELVDIYGTKERLKSFLAARREYASRSHGVTDDSSEHFVQRLERIKYNSHEITSPSIFEEEQSHKSE